MRFKSSMVFARPYFAKSMFSVGYVVCSRNSIRILRALFLASKLCISEVNVNQLNSSRNSIKKRARSLDSSGAVGFADVRSLR